jgi:hypothetical protein
MHGETIKKKLLKYSPSIERELLIICMGEVEKM